MNQSSCMQLVRLFDGFTTIFPQIYPVSFCQRLKASTLRDS
uniref:Uncharacterized protein n=1 Tax=Arundo donax TaxID=35708 RepID=A0A0A9C2D8_ARUDO